MSVLYSELPPPLPHDEMTFAEHLGSRTMVLDAPHLGPLTRTEELEKLREYSDALSAEWNDLFRRQGEAALALRECGARIQVLERIDTPDPIIGYNEAGGAR